LLDAVERHATLESDALGQYEHIAEASGDPVIALVMRLILEDEERHQRCASRPHRVDDWCSFGQGIMPRSMRSRHVASFLARSGVGCETD